MIDEKILYSSNSVNDFIENTKEVFDTFKVKPIFEINEKEKDIVFNTSMLIDNCYKKSNAGHVYMYTVFFNSDTDITVYMSGYANNYISIPSKGIALYCYSKYENIQNTKRKKYTYILSIKPDMATLNCDKDIQQKMMTKINDVKSFIYYLIF